MRRIGIAVWASLVTTLAGPLAAYLWGKRR